VFRGELGATYAFYSRARDLVGNLEAAPLSPDAQTTVSTNSPILAAIADAAILPAQNLSLTNMVQGNPLGTFLFSLGLNSPVGTSINSTNGRFQWTPGCSQGNTTNLIQVWVTDSARTNLSDLASFTITVDTCVEPSLGQQVVLAGTSGKVPINLISKAALTNLQATLVSPPGRLLNFNIEATIPQICTTSVTPLTNNVWRLELIACTNQSLSGTQQIAWLHFTAADLASAFVRLSLTNLTGNEADGHPVANFAPQSGRVVVVSDEPLLECVHGTNEQPLLILYGKPATGYSIQTRTNLVSSWQSAITNVTLTNLWRELSAPLSSSPVNFFRALRTGSIMPPRILNVSLVQGTNVVLNVRGLANRGHNIEVTPTLSPPVWQTIGNSYTDLDGLFKFTNAWNNVQRQRYYRVAAPY